MPRPSRATAAARSSRASGSSDPENPRLIAARVTSEISDSLWSSNKARLSAIPAVVGVLSSRAYTGHGFARSDMGEVREIAQNARNTGYGNCREYACLAAERLADQGVAQVDIYGKANHAFVVRGRAAGSDPSKPETWGPEAYVVDPWAGQSYQASSENLSKFMFAGAAPDVFRIMPVTDAKGQITDF